MSLPPTIDDIQAWSLVDFESLEIDEAKLTVLVNRAVAYVQDVTGRVLDVNLIGNYELMAQECVQLRVEQLAYQYQDDYTEEAADDLIKSFTAGSYSQTRRDLDETRKAKMVNPWPNLNDALWRLMTDDKRDQWLEWLTDGYHAPAFETTEVDWSDYDGTSFGDGFIWGA